MTNRQREIQHMRAFLLEKYGPNSRCHTSGRVHDTMMRMVRRILRDAIRHRRFLSRAKKDVLQHIGLLRVEKDATSTTLFTGPVKYDDGKRVGFVGFGVKIQNNAPPIEIRCEGLEVTPL